VNWRALALALVPAFAAAALFEALGVPAGALIGSSLAVTAVALAGLRPAVPLLFRNLAFATIGVTLGSGVTPSILADLARFPASLAGLTATVAAVMILSGTVLRRLFGTDPATTLLATSPGAMSYALSITAAGAPQRPDMPTVMSLQSMRLLLITVLLPPLIAFAEGGAVGTMAAVPYPMAFAPSLLVIALGAALGVGFERVGMPAAFLLAGFAVSGIAHGAGWVEGRPASALTLVGFTLAGAVIGERFGRVSLAVLRRLLLAGLTVTAIAVGVSAAFSTGAAAALGLPFGQVWVSYAPGGVEGMSAMALALGYDPIYVATHHIFRLLLLFAILPFILRRLPEKE
jgi:hypothetical protein